MKKTTKQHPKTNGRAPAEKAAPERKAAPQLAPEGASAVSAQSGVKIAPEQAAEIARLRDAIARSERDLVRVAIEQRIATDTHMQASGQLQALMAQILETANLDRAKDYRYDVSTQTLAPRVD